MTSSPINTIEESTLDEMFRRRADSFGVRSALHVDGREVSYVALENLRRSFHAAIVGAGLGDGRGRIGLLSPKCVEAYAAMLAIMSSGNVYVPLSPTQPEERLRSIADVAGLSAWIVHIECLPLCARLVEQDSDVPVLVVGQSAGQSIDPSGEVRLPRILRIPDKSYESVHDQAPLSHGCETAYLMFTSGTTGTPKGVPVTHANVLAMLSALRRTLRLVSEDRLTHFPELTFDFSIGEIFPCWDAGASLYVATASDIRSPAAFVRRHALTVWSSVPTLAAFTCERAQLVPEPMPSLRLSVFCGEALATSLAVRWRAMAPASTILNLYGPTEATVFSTAFEFDVDAPSRDEWVPIGKPLDQMSARVAGTACEALPVGEIGELWLAGAQVFPGYWNGSAEQARCFVKDPHSGTTWYRTGDLAAWTDSQVLVFHGRMDRQIKVRGFRVELQEVDAVLRRLLPATELSVVATSSGVSNDVRITAFLDRTACAERTCERLPQRCAELLPAYMIPSEFVLVNGLPINHNGKVDLGALETLALTRRQRAHD